MIHLHRIAHAQSTSHPGWLLIDSQHLADGLATFRKPPLPIPCSSRSETHASQIDKLLAHYMLDHCPIFHVDKRNGMKYLV